MAEFPPLTQRKIELGLMQGEMDERIVTLFSVY